MSRVICIKCGRAGGLKSMTPVGFMHKNDFVPIIGLFICKAREHCRRPAKMRTNEVS